MPRGSPDNNTIHRRKVECCVATGRNSRIFRKCTAFPVCRTASRGLSQDRNLRQRQAVCFERL